MTAAVARTVRNGSRPGRSRALTAALLLLSAAVMVSVWNPLLFRRLDATAVIGISVLSFAISALVFSFARARVAAALLIITAVVAVGGMAYGVVSQMVASLSRLEVEETVASPSGRFRAVSACTDFDSPQECSLSVRTAPGLWQREVTVWVSIEEPAAPVPSATWLSDTEIRIDSAMGSHRVSIDPRTLRPTATYCLSPRFCD